MACVAVDRPKDKWQQPSHRIQTHSSVQHHDYELNWHNSRPSFPTNVQTHLPTQTTWEQPSAQKPLKRNKSPPFKGTSTNNSTTASPTHLLNKPSNYQNRLHTRVRTSCSQAVKRPRLRIAASASQWPGDWCSHTQRPPNAADVGTVLPKQKGSWRDLQQTSGRATASLLRLSVRWMGLIAGMRLWGDALQASYNHTVGAKAFTEQEVPALTRVVNGQAGHARMDLVFNLYGSVTYLDVSLSLLPSLAIRPLFSAEPAQKPVTYGQKSRKEQICQIPTHQPRSFHPRDHRSAWPTRQEIH